MWSGTFFYQKDSVQTYSAISNVILRPFTDTRDTLKFLNVPYSTRRLNCRKTRHTVQVCQREGKPGIAWGGTNHYNFPMPFVYLLPRVFSEPLPVLPRLKLKKFLGMLGNCHSRPRMTKEEAKVKAQRQETENDSYVIRQLVSRSQQTGHQSTAG